MVEAAAERVARALVEEALALLGDVAGAGDPDDPDAPLTPQDAARLTQAEQRLDEAAREADGLPTLLAARGEVAFLRGDLPGAQRWLIGAIDADGEQADARYTLARVFEETGDHQAQVTQDLAVLRLDAAADRRQGLGTPEDLARIARAAGEVLEALPEPFAERAAHVPVVLEPRPTAGSVREGFDPRAVGLFEGADDAGTPHGAVEVQTSRIVLFYANLMATCGSEEELREQIEITLLHELGHFFGLDEDGVDALGLR